MPSYKFLTSGGAIEDAPVVSQILLGNSLKPLAPVNITGARNTNLDLVINWARRSRIGAGLRPYTDIPLAEEQTRFEVEVYSGSTLKRTWRVSPNDPQPVIWSTIYSDTGGDGTVSVVETINGGATYTDSPSSSQPLGFGYAIGAQQINGDVRLELEIGADPFPTTVGLLPVGMIPLTAAVNTYPNWYDSASITPADAVKAENLSSAESYVTGDRFIIEINGGVVRYYKNQNQPPAYISTLQGLSYPLRVVATFDSQLTGTNTPTVLGIKSATIQHGANSAIYTKEQQIADFGSTQSAIKVRLYQVSAVVGRGGYVEATI